MPSAIAMFLFVISLIGNFLLSKYIAVHYGIPAGVVLFVVLFLVAAIILGKFASRRLIVTYEDQQREKKRNK